MLFSLSFPLFPGGMAYGPCGDEFKQAFSCFHYSTAEEKGMDCIPQFRAMQECFQKHPEEYGKYADDDDEEEEREEEKGEDGSMKSKGSSEVDSSSSSDDSGSPSTSTVLSSPSTE